ncbi:hypothetical protein BKH37_02775 [Actinomyces naeslundii]|nr:hypothetical protein BKH37_02775 [Actinomyces naeslundii]
MLGGFELGVVGGIVSSCMLVQVTNHRDKAVDLAEEPLDVGLGSVSEVFPREVLFVDVSLVASVEGGSDRIDVDDVGDLLGVGLGKVERGDNLASPEIGGTVGCEFSLVSSCCGAHAASPICCL